MKKFLISMSLVLGMGLFTQLPLAELSTTTHAASYGWKQVNGNWYYYTSSGVKVTGWKSIGGKWYYFNSYGVMKTGWVKDGSKWYFLDSNGAMKTGWLQSGSKWYYLNTDGAMATGWKKVSNTWYYLESSGAMRTGWLQSGSKWYYLKPNGAMQTSWAKVSGKWYFFDTNGTMKTGWVSSGGKWYYLDEVDGFMWTGWIDDNGKLYYLYDNGVMAASTTIDGITLGADGAAIEETGFFNTNLKSTIGQIIKYYNDSIKKDFKVEYEDTNDIAYFFRNTEPLAYAEAGVVMGDVFFPEFLIDLAYALGIPVNEEEMEALLIEASDHGQAHNELVSVYNDGITLEFYWDIENY
ncbi:hypothetical protein AB5I83_08955 [Mesobacillus sp. LC4]